MFYLFVYKRELWTLAYSFAKLVAQRHTHGNGAHIFGASVKYTNLVRSSINTAKLTSSLSLTQIWSCTFYVQRHIRTNIEYIIICSATCCWVPSLTLCGPPLMPGKDMISYSPGAVSGSPATDDLSLSARRERKQIDRRQSKHNYLARVLVVKYAHTCVCVCVRLYCL